MSAAEVLVAVQLGLVPDTHDELDTWPLVRRHVPAHAWGIYNVGLRHAQPFDGLLRGVAA